MRALGLALSVSPLILTLVACLVPEEEEGELPPTQELGRWHFVGTLQENTCGSAAVPALDPIEFTADLSRTGDRAEYRRLEAPLTYGTVRADESWRFESGVQVQGYEADPLTGRPACNLLQIDELVIDDVPVPASQVVGDGGVDAGPDAGPVEEDEEPEPLVGRSIITLGAAPGYDCSAAVAVYGGPFLALPCQIRYDLEVTEVTED